LLLLKIDQRFLQPGPCTGLNEMERQSSLSVQSTQTHCIYVVHIVSTINNDNFPQLHLQNGLYNGDALFPLEGLGKLKQMQ
jgi:hypothetical protein